MLMAVPRLEQGVAELIAGHADRMVDIPTEPFILKQLDDDKTRNLVKRLADTRAVNTESVSLDPSSPDVLQYELTDLGKARRKEVIGSGYRPLPCDHAGLRNVDGEHYACCYDACDKTFERAEVDLDA